MSRIMTNQEVQAHAKKLVARLLGQDSAMDDETASQIKQFLSSKLSHEDHAKVCSMMDGGGEAQDDDLPENAVEKPPGKGSVSAASDARLRDDFSQRYPGLAHIKVDNSGIQPKPRGRASRVAMDAASSKSFSERYPGLAHIRQA